MSIESIRNAAKREREKIKQYEQYKKDWKVNERDSRVRKRYEMQNSYTREGALQTEIENAEKRIAGKQKSKEPQLEIAALSDPDFERLANQGESLANLWYRGNYYDPSAEKSLLSDVMQRGTDEQKRIYYYYVAQAHNNAKNQKAVKGAIEGSLNTQPYLDMSTINRYLSSIEDGISPEISQDISAKKQLENQLEWVQKGTRLASVGTPGSENYDKDFETKSKYVPESGLIQFGNTKARHKYINANDTERITLDDSGQFAKYGKMNAQEIALYNYYYNTGGKDAAEEYLHTIEEDLSRRQALEQYEWWEDKPTWVKELYMVPAGINQFATGMEDLFDGSDEYNPANTTQQLSGMIRSDMGKVAGTIYDLGTTVFNMAPSIAASAAAGMINPTLGTAVGTGLMGASAAGNAYAEKINAGWDDGQAKTYAAITGVSESVLQYALGGIGKLGGVSTKLATAVKGIDKAAARFALQYGGKVLSEGFEEGLQEVLTPFIENMALGYEKNNWSDVDWEEAAYSAMLGALSAGALEVVPTARSTFGENSKAKKIAPTLRGNNDAQAVFDAAASADADSDVGQLYAAYVNKGVNPENATDVQLGRLYQNAKADGLDLSDVGRNKQEYNHLYDETKVSKEFLESVNKEIEPAISNIRNGNLDSVPNVIEVTELNDKAVKDISSFVGFDVSDYKCKIEKDALIHIENRHGINGKQDQSLSDPKDIARIGYVLNHSDNIEWVMDEKGNVSRSKKYNGKDNRLSPVMSVSAKIDGTYCVSQVVPDTKSKTIWVTSARIQKADGGSQVPNADNSPQPTSGTPLVSSSASTNIPQSSRAVKESNSVVLQRVEALSKNGETITAEDAKAASGYGVHGAMVLADAVNNSSGQSFSQVKGDMHNAYLAGLSNKGMRFETDLQREAYFAGKKDRAMNQNAQGSVKSSAVKTLENDLVQQGVPGADRQNIVQVAAEIEKSLSGTKQTISSVVSGVRKITSNIARVISQKVGDVQNPWGLVHTNLQALASDSGLSDGDFVASYTGTYLDAMRTGDPERYAQLSSGVPNLSGALVEYIQSGTIPDGVQNQEAFVSVAEDITNVVQMAENMIGNAKEQLYGERTLSSKDDLQSGTANGIMETSTDAKISYALDGVAKQGKKKSGQGRRTTTSNRQMRVFPPFDESQSEANEISTRWAHQEDVEEGAMKIAFYHDGIYLIEKTNESDLGYEIIRKISKKEYDKWLQKNRSVRDGKDTRKQSNGKGVNQSRGKNRGNDTDGGIESGSDRDSVRHRRESQGFSRLDSNQDERREPGYERNGNYEHRFEDKSNELNRADESEVKENEQRNILSDGGQQRDIGQHSGEQVAGLVKATESGARTAKKRQSYTKGLRKESLTERVLTDTEGNKHRFSEIKRSSWNKEMHRISEYYENKGTIVHFIKGKVRITFEGQMKSAPAMRVGNDIYVSYDTFRYSPQQLAMHEYIHSKYDTPEVQSIKEEVFGKLTSEERNSMIDRVKSAYGDITKDSRLYEEEVVCNILSGMYRSENCNETIQNFWANENGSGQGYDVSQYAESIDAGGKSKVQKFKYLFIGDKAKTADLSALAEAKKMRKAGVDAKTIWNETGWGLGLDGKWRSEISDNDAILEKAGIFQNPDIKRFKELEYKKIAGDITEQELEEVMILSNILKGVRKSPKYLYEFLKHDALFKTYPELADVEVVFEKLEGKRGEYSSKKNQVRINNSLDNTEALSTLLHEIQHAIQHIEGFEPGGSPKIALDFARKKAAEWLIQTDDKRYNEIVAKGNYAEVTDYIDQFIKEQFKMDDMNKIAEEIYWNFYGEKESQSTQDRFKNKLTPEQRRENYPDYDKEAILKNEGEETNERNDVRRSDSDRRTTRKVQQSENSGLDAREDAEATNGRRGEKGSGTSHINYALDENGMWEMEHIFENDDPEAAAAMEQNWKAMVEKYGAIPKGENPARDVSVPKKISKDKKVSQTVRTILEAKSTPDEAIPTIEKMVEQGEFSYNAYTDKQAIHDATRYIKKHGWVGSLTDWFDSVEKGNVSKEITAMGWALYNNAANTAATTESKTERDTAMETAMKILNAMVQNQRSAAQALQATRILKQLSPETQLYGVQKSVQALQKELVDRYGEKAPKLEINKNLAEQFLKAETEEARMEAEKAIYRDIGRQMPSRFMDKWNAWRYLAMLGNLRTHVRNVVGNAGFAPVVAVKNLTATGIEALVNRISGGKTGRSKALVLTNKSGRELLEAAWGDYAKIADIISNGGKYNDSANANQYIEEGREIFKNKPIEWARKKNSAILELEDMWFAQPHYAYALAQYCKANNITAEQIKKGIAIEPARVYAIKEAQKATYRDTNAFSHMVSRWGRSGGKNKVERSFNTIVDGTLPFRKTPANILVRGVEYSPLGLLKGLSYDLYQVSKGNMSATEAIDNISAGLTGTGLLALGVYLAAQGLIRGHGEGEKEERKFYELMGHQSYSLELPNGTSVTLDWLAPEALPFFVGVNIWEATKGSGEEANLSTVLQALTNITEPMLEMSCLQSLNELVKGVGYASEQDLAALTAILSSSLTSYLTQGIPTLFGQAERTGEENRMTTYTEKNGFLTGGMQYTLGRISAKIPFVDYQQIPYIDAWGRKEASGSALKRGLNNFLNPAYTSTIESSNMEKELLRLYEETGDAAVFPARADKYFTVDKARKDLTADEYVRYATLKGEKSYRVVTNLVKSQAYKSLSTEEKVKAIGEAYAYADQKAKQAISNHKPDLWVTKADGFGSNVGNFFSFRADVSDTRQENGGKISKQEVVNAVLDMAQNDSEAWNMYLSMYDSKGDIYAHDNGVQGETYMKFLDALNDVDKPSKSGEYGTYTQDEAYEALKNLDGVSRQDKAVLWQSVNSTWKAKNNPFR